MIANGGNTFAFFTRNPRGGKAKEINEKDIEKFLALAGEASFRQDRCPCALYAERLRRQRESPGICQGRRWPTI